MINKQLIVMQAEAGYDLQKRPEACIIKLIMAAIYSFHNKIECFSVAMLSSLV
jgi:hypothetical protein